LWGGSQGGWIVPAVAALGEVAFAAVLSAASVTPFDQEEFSLEQRMRDGRAGEREIAEALAFYRHRAGRLRRGDDPADVAAEQDALDVPWLGYATHDGLMDAAALAFLGRIGDHDPVPDLRRVACPVLAVWGERDPLVPVARSVAAYHAALGGSPPGPPIVRASQPSSGRTARIPRRMPATPEPAPDPVVLSWSGGKDSALTLHVLRGDESVTVTGLLTTVTSGYDRISMHGVRLALLDAQARALGLPVTHIRLSPESSNEQYEQAMAAALDRARRTGVRQVAFGDLFLPDIRAYREAQLEAVGMEATFPVWGRDTAAFAREVLDHGFRAVLVCVDTEQLDASYCGREFDESLLAELPRGVDPCGENGEFHTFVYDGPGFATPVPFTPGAQVTRDGRFRYQDLLPAAAART
jgi:uncharacterized protein (TIGR00290 family)